MTAASELRARKFRAAEARLLARAGVEVRETFVRPPRTGAEARVLLCGTPGRTTLYVHGGGAFGAIWAPLVARLDGQHVVPDRPGFGLSAPVDLRRADFRRHAVDFLIGILDALGLPEVDVVGNSMGGLWSLWLALDAPERVRRLALLGAPAITGGGSAPLALRLLGRPLIGRLVMATRPPSESSVRQLWRHMGASRDVDDEMIDAWLASERLPAFGGAWRAVLAKAFTLRGPNPRYALGPEQLAHVRAPTLVVRGRRDPFGDAAMGSRIAHAIPSATYVDVDGCHLPWIDAPAACASALEAHFTR